MRKLILLMLMGISVSLLKAQSEVDALRYSFLTHGGTARYVGMSGAFGALGADCSSLSTNPAGLGSFRSSSIMFSPIFVTNTSQADYKNELSSSEKAFVNLNNIGLIINFRTTNDESSGGWKGAGFGFGYNKLKTFNQDFTINASNKNSSRLDQFMLNSDGLKPDSLNSAEWTAFDTYLIDTIPNSGLLYINPYYGNVSKYQKKRVLTNGSVGEYVIAMGANYNDVFQVGLAIGFPTINYTEKSTFTESSDSTQLASYTYTENLNTKGSGFNLKLGFIYRPVEFFRIGFAFHTRTYYTLKDVYSYEADAHFRKSPTTGKTDFTSTGDGEMEYSYELYTPMRLIVSTAFVFPKIGIFSADYEYVKYNGARLRADNYDFKTENNTISSTFKAGHNLRLGAEIKLSPVYLRGGVSYYSSPDKGLTLSDIKSFSLGAGIRTKNVFVDFAYNHSIQDYNYKLYDYEIPTSSGIEYSTETSKLHFKDDLISLTIGFVF